MSNTERETFQIDECDEAFVRDFMPYKGTPDPHVVWRAAWNSARAALPQAQQAATSMRVIAERNLRSFLAKASFASNVDRQAALNCVDVLAAQAVPASPERLALAEECKRLLDQFGRAVVRCSMFVTSENCDALLAADACAKASIDRLASLPAPPAPPAQPMSTRQERLQAAMARADADGPYPGMIAAFDAHMGASCWTEPEYRTDAAMWAAAWKAAQPAADEQELGDWMTHIQMIQNVALVVAGSWSDEFLAWYKPYQWIGVHRAACVFIGNKMRGHPAGHLRQGERTEGASS